MLAFLRYAADHPDQIAVALHEYSYLDDNIARFYPYLVGRFQALFDICDRQNISRPTILITEWGWTYQTVPDVPAQWSISPGPHGFMPPIRKSKGRRSGIWAPASGHCRPDAAV
jgi:hypothetical protein